MAEPIIWNPDLVALHIGNFGLRWYSLCWGIGLVLAYFIVARLYRRQGIPGEKFDPLFFYCLIGILVGARLGHCLFYEPAYFLSHPVEMFLPISRTADGWRYTAARSDLSWHFGSTSGE